MQRDAKFGLVVGVVLVMVIAVVFSRQEPAMSAPQDSTPTVSTTRISGAGELPIKASVVKADLLRN